LALLAALIAAWLISQRRRPPSDSMSAAEREQLLNEVRQWLETEKKEVKGSV
jgi:hypothetical protein